MRMGRDDRILYNRYLMDRAILRNQMTTARGEGYLDGVDQGRTDEKTETARRMKADGMPTERIAKYTGLSAEEIDQL